MKINTGNKDFAVDLTDDDTDPIVASNDEGDCFGVELDIEALIKSRQQDSATIQVKVFSTNPLSMSIANTNDPFWKFTQ